MRYRVCPHCLGINSIMHNNKCLDCGKESNRYARDISTAKIAAHLAKLLEDPYACPQHGMKDKRVKITNWKGEPDHEWVGCSNKIYLAFDQEGEWETGYHTIPVIYGCRHAMEWNRQYHRGEVDHFDPLIESVLGGYRERTRIVERMRKLIGVRNWQVKL